MSTLLRNLIILSVTGMALICSHFISAADLSPREALAMQLRDWLSGIEGIAASTISVMDLDARVSVPNCTGGFEFSFPFNDKSTVRVSCPISNWSVITRATFPRVAQQTPQENGEQRAVVSYRLVSAQPAGRILTSADIEIAEPERGRRPAGSTLNLGQLVGAKLVRDMPRGAILQVSDVQLPHRVLTVLNPLQRGSALTESNTRIMVFYGALPADSLTSLDGLRRMVASTQLRPGQPLRLSNLRQLADVMRGDELRLTVRRGPVTIETAVIALDDGIVGEQIEVQSTESGETFRVTVTDVGRAEPR